MENQFKLHIHHRAKGVKKDEKGNTVFAASTGHFFVSLQNGSNTLFFGKYPSKESFSNYLYSEESIKTEEERKLYEELKKVSSITGEEVLTTKTFKLTEAQYKKALRFVKSKITQKDSENYTLGAYDCIDFAQSVYNAAGLQLYFTIAFTAKELIYLKTLAALKVIYRYGSNDAMPQQFHCIEALSKQELATRLNVDINKIVQIPTFINWDLPQITDGTGILFHVDIDKNTMKLIEGSILKDNIFDVDLIQNAIYKIFLHFKIVNDSQSNNNTEKSSNLDKFPNYPNFEKLKHIITSELQKFKQKFKDLKVIHSSLDSSSKTQADLMKIYEEKMKELQDKFKKTHEFAQNNPGQYKYEPDETLPGMASFNREQLKITQWLTEELSKLPNPPYGITSSVSDSTAVVVQAKLIDNWNHAIEHLSNISKFNSDLHNTLENVDGIRELINDYLENFIKEQEAICRTVD